MLPYKRSERVADAIRRELGEMLARGRVKDPRVGMVTITDVEMTDDLRHANIFFSNLGSAKDHERAQQGLSSAAKFLRVELASRLKLRVAPDLSFQYDGSFERAGRLAELFAKIRKEST